MKVKIEELVDEALTEPELPEYIKNKRTTIISEVKKGKKVEHVIDLMRAIFG